MSRNHCQLGSPRTKWWLKVMMRRRNKRSKKRKNDCQVRLPRAELRFKVNHKKKTTAWSSYLGLSCAWKRNTKSNINEGSVSSERVAMISLSFCFVIGKKKQILTCWSRWGTAPATLGQRSAAASPGRRRRRRRRRQRLRDFCQLLTSAPIAGALKCNFPPFFWKL